MARAEDRRVMSVRKICPLISTVISLEPWCLLTVGSRRSISDTFHPTARNIGAKTVMIAEVM